MIAERVKGHELVSRHDKHCHDGYEIYLYLGNEMALFIHDRNYQLHCHDIALIDRCVYHKTHYCQNDKDRERILIEFDLSALDQLNGFESLIGTLFSLGKLQFSSAEDRCRVEENMLRLCATVSPGGKSPVNRLLAKTQLQELLLNLIGLFERDAVAADRSELNTVEARVAEVARYLNENHRADLRLEDLARRFMSANIHYTTTSKGSPACPLSSTLMPRG